MAIPGSPAAGWLVDLLAGGEWQGITSGARPEPRTDENGLPVLRVAIGAMVTPERTYSDYHEVFSLIAEYAGRRLDLVQRKTYREINDLIESGMVDIAWVCTGAVADLDDRGAARLIAVPVIGGRTDYRSYIIVREESPASSIDDLRGKTFAFTDPLSLSGRKVVVDRLTHLGATVETFFSETFFTHAHDNSILAVRNGLADGGCVDSLVYDYLADLDPGETSGTRVVWRSERYPIPPLVTPSSLDRKLFDELRAIILQLHRDSRARPFLDHLRVESFSGGESTVYFPE